MKKMKIGSDTLVRLLASTRDRYNRTTHTSIFHILLFYLFLDLFSKHYDDRPNIKTLKTQKYANFRGN